MKQKSLHSKEILFWILYTAVLVISCWPGLFDLSNHIYPLIFGVPFDYMWQVFLSYVTVALFVIQYRLDLRDGDTNFEIDPDYDYLKDIHELDVR